MTAAMVSSGTPSNVAPIMDRDRRSRYRCGLLARRSRSPIRHIATGTRPGFRRHRRIERHQVGTSHGIGNHSSDRGAIANCPPNSRRWEPLPSRATILEVSSRSTDINIAALPVKVSPAGGDLLLLSDQSASGLMKADCDFDIAGRERLGYRKRLQ